MAYAVEHQYTRTPVRRFLEVFRDEHQFERRPCGLTPVHPSEAAPKKRPCHAAGIFPIKPKKSVLSRSRLPVPVRSVESGVRSSKVQAKSIGTVSRIKGKSRIPVLANQFTIHAPRIEALKKREREIMAEFLKVRAERERVENLQRKLLVHKPTPAKTRKRRSKSLALDSPFSFNESPNIGKMYPVPLLSPNQSKNPGSIYESYRRTLTFLQTPSRSTFKQRTRSTLQNDNGTRNVSQLVQNQLAHLFA